MAGADSTSLDAVLKDVYTPEAVKDLTYEDNTWHGLIPKDTDGEGRRFIQPVQFGEASGRSRTFSTAQNRKGANQYEDFIIPWVDDFMVHSISRKVMKQTKGKKGAFFKAETREIDSGVKKLMRNCAISEYRGSGGARAQVNASYSSGTSFTLMDPEEITNLEKGEWIVYSSANGDTSSDTLASATAVQITAVNRDTGTVTVSATTGLAASYYIFAEGDFQAAMLGLLAWIPTTAPGATAFAGVDRSVEITRLAGSRISATNVSIRNAIAQGLARLGRESSSADTVLMNHAKFRDLELEYDAKCVYERTEVTPSIGFKGISFVGGGNNAKPVTCYADRNCPNDNIFILTKDTWTLISLGDVPDMVDDDGVTMLREATSAGYEVRADYYANVVCDAPKDNLVLTVT